MPDAFTHISIPSLFSKYLKKHFILPVFMIGTVLPDYLRTSIAFFIGDKHYYSVILLHTLIGVLLTSILFSLLFCLSIRKNVFYSIFCGQLLHLMFDMTQSFLCKGRLYLLFPIRKNFELHIFNESNWLKIFMLSASIYTGYHLFNFIKKIFGRCKASL